MPMPLTVTNALISLCLLAAQADGLATSRETDAITKALNRVDAEGTDVSSLQRSIASREVTIKHWVSALISSDSRQLAYELASGICSADGGLLNAESTFLANLSKELSLSAAVTSPVNQAAQTFGSSHPEIPAIAAAGGAAATSTASASAESDSSIQNYSILCAALELLPIQLLEPGYADKYHSHQLASIPEDIYYSGSLGEFFIPMMIWVSLISMIYIRFFLLMMHVVI